MLRLFLRCTIGSAVITLLSISVLSIAAFAGHNPADYPLRVHIFTHNSHSHYYHETLQNVDGEGRANLFENSEAHGFDFSYQCVERLVNSSGFETYPARWKKPNQKLEILLPKMGKPGSTDTCDLQVEMKDFAYFRHNGNLDTESAADYKRWMEKHEYDPEHDKNEPVRAAPAEADAPPNAPQ